MATDTERDYRETADRCRYRRRTTFDEIERAGRVRKRTLAEMWPARSGGAWPKGLSLRRADIYDDGV